MKNTLLATTAIVFVAATASAVDVELYGQVNKGLYSYDDGQNTDVVINDNAKSNTRMGVKGAQALDNGLTASVLLEGAMSDNASDAYQQSNVTLGSNSQTPVAGAAATFTSRQARVGMSGNFGGLYLGKQSTASDGAFTVDLAGANDVMDADIADIGGGLGFRTAGTGVLNTGFTPNAMTYGMSENITNSIRYDSPIFNGVQGRAAIAQGGDMDMGVYYDGGVGDFKVAAAGSAFFNNDENTTATNVQSAVYTAAASARHNSGLGATLGYASASLDKGVVGANDPSQMYAKVGYAWDAFEVAADYTKSEHWRSATAASDKLTSMGVAAQYNVADGVSVAALLRNFDADVTGTATDAINLMGVNMRVKF
ncbi:MAG: porin [Alphaproteobacteria bacterium]